jgi:hypothetical protein
MRKLLIAVCVFGLFAVTGRTDDEPTPPSPNEVAKAIQEYKDALATLRTAERALEGSTKKVERLLKQTPPAACAPAQATQCPPGCTPAYPPAPAPATAYYPPAALPVDPLKVVLDRLQKMEQRMAELEKCPLKR